MCDQMLTCINHGLYNISQRLYMPYNTIKGCVPYKRHMFTCLNLNAQLPTDSRSYLFRFKHVIGFLIAYIKAWLYHK